MRHGPDRFGLTAGLLALTAVQAIWGRAAPNLYRDAPEIALTWVGNDWIVLLVAVPVIGLAARRVARGSRKGRLVWMGGLAFLIYNYAFYTIGTELNAAFPLYLALVLGAGVALGQALLNTVPRAVPMGIVTRVAAAYLLGLAIVLTLVWLALWARIVFAGAEGGLGPDAFQVVAAADMTLLVPGLVLGGLLLLRGHPWGGVIAPVAAVQGALYLLILTTNGIVFVRAGLEAPPGQVVIWGPLLALTAASAVWLLRRAD